MQYQPAPPPEWPIRVERYDPAADKWPIRRRALICASITFGAFILALPLILTDAHGTLNTLAVILVIITIMTLPFTILLSLKTLDLLKVPSRPGLIITGQAILDAYARYGVGEIALSPPIIGLSGQEWYLYSMARNDVTTLWFQPTAQPHRYTLYWRQNAYKDFESVGGGCIERITYERPTPRDLKWSARHMADLGTDRAPGVDLRMRPCILEIWGGYARLLFPTNAPLLVTAMQDANIRGDIYGVIPPTAMLADTF
ncbi:hypothetical protein [Bifidobacterium goeldii]|nr:hypothetical protein [Bifidobacterium goeldii]